MPACKTCTRALPAASVVTSTVMPVPLPPVVAWLVYSWLAAQPVVAPVGVSIVVPIRTCSELIVTEPPCRLITPVIRTI